MTTNHLATARANLNRSNSLAGTSGETDKLRGAVAAIIRHLDAQPTPEQDTAPKAPKLSITETDYVRLANRHASAEAECRNLRAELATLREQPDTPSGLVISDDGRLLNWRGENYVRQADPVGKLAIDSGWLIEVVDEHTCGAGPGSGAGHEPGCGTVPVCRLDDLDGWPSGEQPDTRPTRGEFTEEFRRTYNARHGIDGLLEIAGNVAERMGVVRQDTPAPIPCGAAHNYAPCIKHVGHTDDHETADGTTWDAEGRLTDRHAEQDDTPSEWAPGTDVTERRGQVPSGTHLIDCEGVLWLVTGRNVARARMSDGGYCGIPACLTGLHGAPFRVATPEELAAAGIEVAK